MANGSAAGEGEEEGGGRGGGGVPGGDQGIPVHSGFRITSR